MQCHADAVTFTCHLFMLKCFGLLSDVCLVYALCQSVVRKGGFRFNTVFDDK